MESRHFTLSERQRVYSLIVMNRRAPSSAPPSFTNNRTGSKKFLLIGMLLGLPMAMSPFMNEGIAAEGTVAAQRQPSGGELLRQIERLSVVGNVLYVAAHPDDENTRLLAYLSRERLLRTAYLSLTRGDGGQNLIGSEQGPLLGLVRTQELLAARRIDGAEQFFTRARDFGYSKTPVETMEIWGKDAVLSDTI